MLAQNTEAFTLPLPSVYSFLVGVIFELITLDPDGRLSTVKLVCTVVALTTLDKLVILTALPTIDAEKDKLKTLSAFSWPSRADNNAENEAPSIPKST